MAWLTLTNLKTLVGSIRSPEQTRPRLLTRYLALLAGAGSHAANGSAPHARHSSNPLRDDPPPDHSAVPKPGSNQLTVHTHETGLPACGQTAPNLPSDVGTRKNTGVYLLPSWNSLSLRMTSPRNRVNFTGSCPNHPGSCPSHPGSCPSHPGSCPSHPGSCPSHPGSCPNHPGSRPNHPGSRPSHPGSCPNHPGSCPSRPGSCPSAPP